MATIVGFIVMFLLSYLWHALLLADFYRENTPAIREQYQIQFIAFGYLVLAFLMSYIYPKGYQGGKSVPEGLNFGVIVGLLWILPYSIILHGVMAYPRKLVLVDAIWHMVEQGIGGIVIASLYRKVESTTSTSMTPESSAV